MDLSYSAESDAFRRDVAAFLKANWDAAAAAAAPDRREREAALRRKAVEHGYLYRGIPRQYGGSEQQPDILKAHIIREEFGKARAPMEIPGVGVQMVVPTLLECGSQWQRDFFVARTLNGEFRWAQGYSEPDAGSDLASVRTSAELVDGHWVINGQKTWSSLAHKAHYMFALVRTDRTARKHAGLSYLLLDLKQPGVTIRPLKQITGDAEFCEVFFDNVRTPQDWIVGAPGEGWAVSKTTLSHERSGFIGSAATSVALFGKLVELARHTMLNGRPAIEDPLVRERLGVLDGYVSAHQYSSYRQFSMAAHGQDAGIAPLMNKLVNTRIADDVAAIARDLIGSSLMLAPPLAGGRGAGNEKWVNQFMGSLGLAIAGGTSNIQRNLIAERGLGLPRDPSNADSAVVNA
ncbi:acyl-CoA dehydrogenase family protein [Massilia putida]|uniref:acyl-CoA dehydrogenase family protein n=1 Tax=Massilia putida TaxID=1141883 RepID=UPI000951566F|nr:acyl-CoA dehydrogenase family protein [Massilia putida]